MMILRSPMSSSMPRFTPTTHRQEARFAGHSQAGPMASEDPMQNRGIPLTPPTDLTHRAPIHLRGFDAGTTAWIREILASCHYGKDLATLTRPESRFKVHPLPKGVILENFTADCRNNTLKRETCEGLTYAVGKLLEQGFGKDYAVFAVGGNCPGVFQSVKSLHMYLLAVPKTPAVYNRVLEHFREDPYSLPADCLIIDPSRNVMGHPGADDTVRGYTMRVRKGLDELAPSSPKNRHTVLACTGNKSDLVPLGSVRSLIPQAANESNDSDLIWLGFHTIPGANGAISFEPVLLCQKPDDRSLDKLSKLTLPLPPNHPLQRFLDKINADLRRPVGVMMDDFNQLLMSGLNFPAHLLY